MPEETETKPEEIQGTSDGGRLTPSEIEGEAMTPPRWREKIKIHKFKILGGVLGIFIFTGAVFGAYKLGQKQIQPAPQPTPTPVVVATPTPDPTANWETYRGKHFSFKHPRDWTDNTGPAVNYPDNLEVIGLRISPNAVFEASYKNYSYEKNVQGLAHRKSSKLTISSREATRFEVTGSGEPLPSGFSIISFVVKGTGNTSYSIDFNGDRKNITEELINQILSTFKFLD